MKWSDVRYPCLVRCVRPYSNMNMLAQDGVYVAREVIWTGAMLELRIETGDEGETGLFFADRFELISEMPEPWSKTERQHSPAPEWIV